MISGDDAPLILLSELPLHASFIYSHTWEGLYYSHSNIWCSFALDSPYYFHLLVDVCSISPLLPYCSHLHLFSGF